MLAPVSRRARAVFADLPHHVTQRGNYRQDVFLDELPPIHPGEVLLEEFLVPMGISQYRLAKSTSVPPRRINEIVHGKRAVTADTALRLSRFFGTSEPFWLNLQTQYDLATAKDRLGASLEQEVLVYEVGK